MMGNEMLASIPIPLPEKKSLTAYSTNYTMTKTRRNVRGVNTSWRENSYEELGN